MKYRALVPVMLGLLVATSACGPPAEEQEPATEQATSTQEAAEGFDAIAAQWDASLNGHDVEGVLSIFGADPVTDVRNEVEGVRAAGDLAVGWGTYTLTITPEAGGEPLTDMGKWMAIAERQPDGTWRGLRNIWNQDAPPSGDGS
jgi:ketosteroid isomerase-like protein